VEVNKNSLTKIPGHGQTYNLRPGISMLTLCSQKKKKRPCNKIKYPLEGTFHTRGKAPKVTNLLAKITVPFSMQPWQRYCLDMAT